MKRLSRKAASLAQLMQRLHEAKQEVSILSKKLLKQVSLEDLTERELEARMKQIINEYAPILNAKPIEEIKKEVKAIGSL